MAVYQSLSVIQVSQNPEENTSLVRILWQSTQTGGSYNDTRRTARYTVACNGEEPETYTVSYTLPGKTVVTIVDTTVTVPHDEKGEATVTVTTWMNTNISAGVVELSQSLKPDTIQQAATLMATDAPIGGVSRLAVTRKNAEHTHSIAFQFGALSGYVDDRGQVQTGEVKCSGDSLDFLIPLSFYGQIPNEKQGTCYLTLQTYLGNVPVGQPRQVCFTAWAEEAACRPLVTGQVTDENPQTCLLTGDERVLIPYASRALCVIQTQPQNGATIQREVIAGREVFDGRLVISDPQLENIRFLAEDSRGYQTQVTPQVPILAYEKPVLEARAVRTDPVSGSALLTAVGTCFSGSFGAQENTLSAAYSTDGVNFQPMAVSLEENRYTATAQLANMDYSRVYSITVRVWDKLFTAEKTAVLKKTLPVFDWGEGDFAFHVPVTMDVPLALAQGGTGRSQWQHSGVVFREDDGLTALPTAPGALYAPQEGNPCFGVLPVSQGGTGGTDGLTACQELGLVLPMETGVEYATYGRWQGRTVYTKLVDFGKLPNTKVKAVPHGAAAGQMLGCRGTLSNGHTLPWGGVHYYRADLFGDRENVYIDTEWDYSDQSAVVQIFYTK